MELNKTTFEKIAQPPSLRLILLLVLLVIIPLICFIDVKDFEFVSLDDGLHIYTNPLMEQVSKASILSFWKEPYQYLYIPVSYTAWSILAANSKCTGSEKPFNPAVFHWANLILHLINTILVFLILRRIISNDWAAFAGAIVFSLHPVQIESVAWISEFRGLLSGAFALAAILIVLWEMQNNSDKALLKNRWKKIKSVILLAGASLLFLSAMLSKPSAIVTPLIVVALAFNPKNKRRLFVVMGLWVLLAFPIMLVTGKAQMVGGILPLWQRPFVFLDAIGFYTSKILLPFSLCVDYGRTPLMIIQNYSWLAMTVFANSVFIGLLLIRKWVPNIIRSSLVFFFALLPVSGIIPFIFQYYSTVADRYLYLPMVGIALLVASVLATARRAATVAVVGGWIVFLAVLGVQQLATWENSKALYNHTIKVNPNSYLSLLNLGNVLLENGDFKGGVLLYRKSIIKRPDFYLGYYNSAKIFYKNGNYPGAIYFCARALFFRPNYLEVHELLGEIYSKGGRHRPAIENMKQVLNLAASTKKCPSELYNNVAVQYLYLGEKKEAFKYFTDAISCHPKEIFARLNRGRLLQEFGRCNEAEKDYRDVLKIEPANTTARARLDVITCDSTKRN
jgi:tetratricopeptide (TPR) repeat protein